MRHVLIAVSLMVFMCGSVSADEIDDIIPFVIQVESGGDPNAVSKAGAVGLMQITPIVLKEFQENCDPAWGWVDGTKYDSISQSLNEPARYEVYTTETLKCPRVNKTIGEWYLRRLRDHYLGTKGADILCQPMLEEMNKRERDAGNEEASGLAYGQWRVPDELWEYIHYTTEQDLCMILAAYNGGITRFRKCDYDINKMPRETRSYVKKVIKLYKEGQ